MVSNLFAWEVMALMAGVIVYVLTMRWAWEKEGIWMWLWALLFGIILSWICLNQFPSLSEASPILDIFMSICLMLWVITHIVAVVCFLAD